MKKIVKTLSIIGLCILWLQNGYGKCVLEYAFHPAGYRHDIRVPVYNFYMGDDGGYLAIYSHSHKGSAYKVNERIYVIALIRVQGDYNKEIFIPKGYKPGDDISQDQTLKKLALQHLQNDQHKSASWRNRWNMNNIWLGGDTGGFC